MSSSLGVTKVMSKIKNQFKKTLNDSSFWIDICGLYLFGTFAMLINARWYIWALFAVIAGSIAFVKYKKTNHTYIGILKKTRAAIKIAKKIGDPVVIYNTLENDVIPELRKSLPQNLFKYYSLCDDETSNQRKISTLKNNEIWSSVCSEFNDPFECQYMHMEAQDFEELGIPPSAKSLWDKIMAKIRQRITIICFTQNPDNRPMWAHYANGNKGFCIEYQVTNTAHLYPVIYVEKRHKAHALFIELVYELFTPDLSLSERGSALKHIILLNSFKDISWESENEIRAIFINSLSEISPKGRSFSCTDIGVHPCKMYIGAMCSESNKEKLKHIAQEVGIEYEICHISSGENFSVI